MVQNKVFNYVQIQVLIEFFFMKFIPLKLLTGTEDYSYRLYYTGIGKREQTSVCQGHYGP